MQLQERHTKACSHCSSMDWTNGEMYYTNFAEPYGADKLCEGCIEEYAEEQGWQEPDDDEESPPVDGGSRYRIFNMLPHGVSVYMASKMLVLIIEMGTS